MRRAALVEEAALRREILLLGDQRAADRVVFLARQYITRFGRSIYADNFVEGLAGTAIRYGLTDDLPSLQKFLPLLTTVTPAEREAFLLTVARAQILNGKFEVAGAAARDALRDIPSGAPDEARAKLYEAAAQIVTSDYDAGVEKLKSLDRSRLAKPDSALLAAVTFEAARLRDPPSDKTFEEVAREPPETPDPARASPEAKLTATIPATLRLGAAALGRTISLAREAGDNPMSAVALNPSLGAPLAPLESPRSGTSASSGALLFASVLNEIDKPDAFSKNGAETADVLPSGTARANRGAANQAPTGQDPTASDPRSIEARLAALGYGEVDAAADSVSGSDSQSSGSGLHTSSMAFRPRERGRRVVAARSAKRGRLGCERPPLDSQ